METLRSKPTENIRKLGGGIFTFLTRKEEDWPEQGTGMTTKYFSNLFLVSEID